MDWHTCLFFFEKCDLQHTWQVQGSGTILGGICEAMGPENPTQSFKELILTPSTIFIIYLYLLPFGWP